MKRLRLLLAALCLSGAATHAGADIGVPVTGKLVSGWQTPDGRHVAALQLDLAPGWKTYWRAPGDAGIPPQFDWNGSRNVKGVTVRWPTPVVFSQNGMRSIGYKRQVIIPLDVVPRKGGKPVQLKARMDLGVCRDICVPYTLDFSGTLENGVSVRSPVVAAALAALPFSGAEAGVKAATCRLRPSAEGMQIDVALTLPRIGKGEIIVIEAGSPGIWVSEATTRRQGGTLTARAEMVHQSGGAFALDRSRIRLTVLGKGVAVDVQGCAAG